MAARQGAGAGQLEAGQVRAMFDRISGVYDLMNTAMTAGLHHRWRSRAADLAARRPRQPRARRRHRHRRPRDRARAPRRHRAARWSAATSPRAMLDRARVKAAVPRQDSRQAALRMGRRDGAPLRQRQLRRGDRRVRRSQLRRPRPRPGRDGPRRAPRRPGRGARDHDAHARRRCRCSTASGSTASCRRSGARRALSRGCRQLRGVSAQEDIADAYTYLPNSVKRFPGPRRARGARCPARASSQISYIITAGGIVAIHAGTVPAEPA